MNGIVSIVHKMDMKCKMDRVTRMNTDTNP
jgi:hypothetical protein